MDQVHLPDPIENDIRALQEIFNTLTTKKEEFVPGTFEEGKVRMYVCGPTVYNLSTSVMQDQ